MVSGKWLVVSGCWTTKNISIFIKIAVIFSFLIFGIIACTTQKADSDGIIIADSNKYEATIFRQNCAVCHGAEAFGKTLDGKLVPSLRFGDAAKKSRQEIYNQIHNGKLPMPAFKNQLTEREIQMIVDFVMYDLQGRKRENPK